VLGRISKEDSESAAIVRNHLDPGHEPKQFVRGWTLASLLTGNASDIVGLARTSRQREETNWVYYLALAILVAKSSDDKEVKEARDKILAGLAKDDLEVRKDAAQAVRIVHIPATIEKLAEIVTQGKYADFTHEAIMALSNIPPTSRRVEVAARALTTFIVTQRHSSRRDGMRTKALISLGKLKVESSGPILIEELSDDNPAIVREAAQALEKVLGVRTAASRVVEAASKAGPEHVYQFASALRWMDRSAIVEVLEEKMLSGPVGEQEVARMLLSEMGGAAALQKLRAQTTVMEQYRDVLEEAERKIRDLFESSLREARKGFSLATAMDTTVFAVGVGLIIISAVMALGQQGSLDSWVGIGLTGGVGVLGIIYGILIARPRRQVREAVDHLMYLKIIFLGYLRQLHQTDQAFTRRLLEDEALTPEEVRQFSKMVGVVIEDAVEQLSATTLPKEPESQ
jgi:hypothetical protein